jgi:hypothetical protein
MWMYKKREKGDASKQKELAYTYTITSYMSTVVYISVLHHTLQYSTVQYSSVACSSSTRPSKRSPLLFLLCFALVNTLNNQLNSTQLNSQLYSHLSRLAPTHRIAWPWPMRHICHWLLHWRLRLLRLHRLWGY